MLAVDKLRTAARNVAKGRNLENHEECNLFLIIADEIESEIERDYMLLPKDADGVPIHVGDEMTCHGSVFKVCAIAPAKVHAWATTGLGKPRTTVNYEPGECTHHHPPTVEDVLRDVVTLCASTWKDDRSAFKYYGVDDVMKSGNMKYFADRLREVLRDDQRI